jgi:dCMP deaminase
MVAFAAKNGIALKDSSLWVTHQPCLKCAELIIQSGFKEVIYLEDFRDLTGIELLVKCKVTIIHY